MARRMSRFIHLAVAAATEAVNDSGLDFAAYDQDQRDRVAVCMNTGAEAWIRSSPERRSWQRRVPVRCLRSRSGPFGFDGRLPDLDEVRHYGPRHPQVAACASSVVAFIDACA